MGNSSSLCNNTSLQKDIIHQVIGKRWIMRYGSDPDKIVEHEQLYVQQTDLRQQLDPILDELRKEKYKYLDPDFSTKPIVLKSDSQNKRCRWERPVDVIGSHTVIYSKTTQDILVKDQIMQYFGTFLIFLKRNPELLSEIILTNNNSFGLHVLQLYIKNTCQHLLIDDKFICDQNKKSYVFSQPLDKSIWPLIIEKAWMKYLGQIKGIEHHQPFQPYSLFVNRPYTILPLKENQVSYIKQIIIHNNNIIFESKKQNVIKIGLSGKKYFTLLCHFFINQQFFALLRNPCGKFGFRGNWAEPTVGQAKKIEELGLSFNSPGNFIIDESQLTQFSSLSIFHYVRNYKTSVVNIDCQVNTVSYVKITIRSDQYVFLSIIQNDDQLYPLMTDLFQIPSFNIIQTNSVWGIKEVKLFETKQYLKGGHYILGIKPKSISANTKKVNVALQIYSSQSIDIEQYHQNLEIYNNFLLQSGRNSNSKQIFKLDFSYMITWQPNRVLIYIRNLHQNGRQIKLDLHFPKIKNLQTIDPSLHQINMKQYCSITLKQQFLLVLQKIELHKQTSIGQFSITSY